MKIFFTLFSILLFFTTFSSHQTRGIDLLPYREMLPTMQDIDVPYKNRGLRINGSKNVKIDGNPMGKTFNVWDILNYIGVNSKGTKQFNDLQEDVAPKETAFNQLLNNNAL
jgi:hypothetical protein